MLLREKGAVLTLLKEEPGVSDTTSGEEKGKYIKQNHNSVFLQGLCSHLKVRGSNAIQEV